jgi:tRNA pseudouridine32 synthase/23S rRNA pseudouridine746 synthase
VTTQTADQTFQKTLRVATNESNASAWLAQQTGLSKGRVKLAMTHGAVLLRKSAKGKWQRLRRATSKLEAGDLIKFSYNCGLLGMTPAEVTLVADYGRYSIWLKPPGVMTQGNDWGDHCSLLRMVQLNFTSGREVFPVHRLDRDACGLVMVAHDKKAAAALSELFLQRKIHKHYRARVEGEWNQAVSLIDSPIDGKVAVTRVENCIHEDDSSLLDVTIDTGRKHQIRRHLAQNGHPVRGDALYGVKNFPALQLAAIKLSYRCPVQGRQITHSVSDAIIADFWQ